MMKFEFYIRGYTSRQGGQYAHVNIIYLYKPYQTTNYRALRNTAKHILDKYLTESGENIYWERIARRIANVLVRRNSTVIEGIQVKILISPNKRPSSFEPGYHGPTYTTALFKQ